MKPFDVFITYMEWTDSGKNRPVLVFITDEKSVDVYQITTQFKNKSKDIQALYFKINDWSQAGLKKQSYVDTGTLITLSSDTFEGKTPIGELTKSDKQRLLEFLSK